jgi:hypothetical protein
MRRLEGEHLTVLGERRFKLRERRAATRRHDQLGRLVGHQAGVAARVEDLARQRAAIEILAAAPAQP